MATVNDKIKKILAMIDGATTEGEARAASLALQRLLVANDMTLDEIALSDDAPEINETGEDVGKRVAVWVKALAYVIASNYRCESYFHVRHERDFWTNRQKITSKQVVFVGEAEDSVVAAGCFRATTTVLWYTNLTLSGREKGTRRCRTGAALLLRLRREPKG